MENFLKESRSSEKQRAFTLIELLVSISIIVVLGAIATPVTMAVMNKAKEEKCRAQIADLSMAIKAYKTEYRVIPLRHTGGGTTLYKGTGDIICTSSANAGIDPASGLYWGVASDFLRALMGLPEVTVSSHDYKGNTRGIVFFTPKHTESKRGGLVRSGDHYSYLDPWGRGFRIHFDADHNGQCWVSKTHGFYQPMDDDIDVQTDFVIMSLGADLNDPSDNICSWK